MFLAGTLVRTNGYGLDAVVDVAGQRIEVMDDGGSDGLSPGDNVMVHIRVGLPGHHDTWDALFSGNPERVHSLEHLGGWRYVVRGVVASVDPVVVQCGDLLLEGPVESRDARLVGAAVAFDVKRLDAEFQTPRR